MDSGESSAGTALCLEALQSCQEATADQSRNSDEEMTPLACYYTEDGRPFLSGYEEGGTLVVVV
jgi:hypothetical protein